MSLRLKSSQRTWLFMMDAGLRTRMDSPPLRSPPERSTVSQLWTSDQKITESHGRNSVLRPAPSASTKFVSCYIVVIVVVVVAYLLLTSICLFCFFNSSLRKWLLLLRCCIIGVCGFFMYFDNATKSSKFMLHFFIQR